MAEHVRVPVRVVDGEQWGALSFLAENHEICGETVKIKTERFSFAGGHRVALYSFKKNVHFRIPQGVVLDISNVTPESAPRRMPRR